MSVTGKLTYRLYYQPKFWLLNLRKIGLFNFVRIAFGKRAMVKAALKLKAPAVNNNAHEVYFLTGRKYWPLTAFCMYSLTKNSTIAIKPVFVDDGSFDSDLSRQINAQFPGCSIKTAAEVKQNIREKLPAEKYPILNKKRAEYPHIRKLTDIHTLNDGWKLVLDSDMLFFKTPAEIQKWLINPQQPLFLYDPITSYYYANDLMERLAANTVKQNLNVGLIGLKSEDIDWEKLENWIISLENEQGDCYLLEQALSAMLVAGQAVTVADPKEYIVLPDSGEVAKPTATLHHYVDQSRDEYYKKAWQQIR